jgi:hypothetical protein
MAEAWYPGRAMARSQTGSPRDPLPHRHRAIKDERAWHVSRSRGNHLDRGGVHPFVRERPLPVSTLGEPPLA